MDFTVGALVDLDDYVASKRAHGQSWAGRQIDQADRAIRAVTVGRLASCEPLPPDEWLVTLTGDDPDLLMDEATALAEELRTRIVRATELTATVSLGTPRRGTGGGAVAERDARRANAYKLLLGGDRVITAPPRERADAQPPVRIEADLARRIQAGDRGGAAGLLASWVDRCVQERDLAPRTLHNWLMGELLFVVDVVNRCRLAGGSTDWVDACARLPIEELTMVTEIHERSYLHIWIEETLRRLMPPAARDILSLAESYMAAHYTDPRLRLSTVAEAVSASPFYISHLFAAERGTTFLRHLTGLRLRHARMLLSASAVPIDTVAARCGYLSAKAFRGVFKRHVGCSPSEYRRTHRPAPA
ncbi:helix-turn-helix transcriptional regulator [Nonomuraea sp. SBT364]|uniref:helix-turn-helix transcriptional regulator n=1 Tax=Nonomuraea sp. SBT364 TaxID=1580530 RepID=UPI00066DE013|nr:helix-turn-helix transcriptional regulator [Nonomuraea sp. SBT364]